MEKYDAIILGAGAAGMAAAMALGYLGANILLVEKGAGSRKSLHAELRLMPDSFWPSS